MRPQKPRRARANPGRVAAARALVSIEDGAFADEVLPELLPEGRDHDLGWFLTLGVLQHRGEIDAALRPLLRQPLGGLEPGVRATLRMGAFEKLFARTKPHAVVSQAVEVGRKLGVGRASSLINAILRRVEPPEDLPREDRLNHPAWLLARWDTRYGAEAVDAWCQDASEVSPLTVVVLPARANAWRNEGLELMAGRAGEHSPKNSWVIRGHRGTITGLSGFANGDFWVQDAAATAVADLCQATEGTTVLDACAAPGGKTLRLVTAGAEVTSIDRSGPRLGSVRENLKRMDMWSTLVRHDWEQGPCDQLEPFDVVLVDAPCSALGTTRRSPEVRWRRFETDLAAAAAKQRVILEAASVHVKPGGSLVYAVCSPEPEEGQEVVDGFLAAHPDFMLELTWHNAPPRHGEDAHQAFRMRRAGEPE